MTSNSGIQFSPTIDKRTKAHSILLGLSSTLAKLSPEGQVSEWVDTIEKVRTDCLDEISLLSSKNNVAVLKAAVSVLCDLVAQGWKTTEEDGEIILYRGQSINDDSVSEKSRIRWGLLVERENIMREPGVRSFISEIEKKRVHNGKWVSIFDLMRDGRELSQKLCEISKVLDEGSRLNQLENTITPYIQFVSPKDKCEFTGLFLSDIWRYFRYTWSSVYKTTPGRSIQILIRDASTKNHPIIGVAALSSAVVQQTVRDNWIHWTPDFYLKKWNDIIPKAEVEWLFDVLESLLQEIYLKDLIKRKLISIRQMRQPDDKLIESLQRLAEQARKEHHLFPGKNNNRSASELMVSDDHFWEQKALSPLFTSKRLEALQRLLGARLKFQQAGLSEPNTIDITKHPQKALIRQAISTIIREVKASHVGIDIMSINVCGSVAPYNSLLGGKLVAMLMASPEIIKEVKRRYGDAPSIIASSIKGAKVVRKPQLVLLETTSLYGIASSQYNRIRIPLNEIGEPGNGKLEYKELNERTEGFGSFHFSTPTVELLNQLQAQSKDYRKVNSIFGEGVSPRMRKIQGGLSELGLRGDELLKHGSQRIVYLLELAENYRDVLIGKAKRPKYKISNLNEATTSKIAKYWTKRWLSPRINNKTILAAVAENTLDYPVEHGARVKMSSVNTDLVSQGELF